VTNTTLVIAQRTTLVAAAQGEGKESCIAVRNMADQWSRHYTV